MFVCRRVQSPIFYSRKMSAETRESFTDVSEGTDVNKTSASKECGICHYWYFLNKGFKFQHKLSQNIDLT